ncbi:BBE domain-containing protein [Ensifer sp. ENS07]|uniref:BBE domain-containing protein n=1 Tax=unclassified Ensifer TaxID=2633371 RepID=UPI00177F0F09|nr:MULTISPECIES: BBE domain-containing protein [unclassified Ensifer]MBD9508145.1 BBE domain-containing protein [Ensifer sp. ENS10]MBD9637359.1 BBE domain-containing protein [Ensifer sp. ENS07]
MQLYSTGRLYLNSPGFGEGENLFVTLSNAETYARLQTVKRAYDPNNFFRMNQNVIPLLMPSAAGSWFGGFYLVAENSRREAPASPEPL